ncbi:MAG TPA: hypothetical protein VGV89_07410 [Thermoplasmata archaeon]|nr:hypothetical protein [Thermoplasmata archaeon]
MDPVRAAPVAEAAFYGEYPFLPGAEELAEGLAGSIRVLLEDPALARARELGRARVRAALDDPRGEAEIAELDRAEPGEKFLSFQYARILLGAAGSPAPNRRWAVSESKRAWGRLGGAPVEELVEVSRRLGVELTESGEGIEVPIVDYVKLATPIREGEFRLIQQQVGGGRVHVSRTRAARLIQEGIRRKLSPPVELTPEVKEWLSSNESSLLGEVTARLPPPVARTDFRGTPLKAAAFPPCIRKMRRTLQEGENLSHAGRFALAAFLHRVGADNETIVDAYRGAPDFDEGVTRYQVEHITRHDEGRGYTPPDCETLRSHGLCVREGDPHAPAPEDRARDALCFTPDLKSPFRYYRIRSGAREARGAAPDTSPAPAKGRSTDRRE